MPQPVLCEGSFKTFRTDWVHGKWHIQAKLNKNLKTKSIKESSNNILIRYLIGM